MNPSRVTSRLIPVWPRAAALLCLAGVLLLAACGGSGSDSPDSEGEVVFTQGADGPEGGRTFSFNAGAEPLQDLADFLGVSVAQLEADLQTAGATQAGVAALYGKTREELKQFLLQRNEENLAKAVEEGDMDQETADTIREAFAENIDATIDSSGGTAGVPIRIGPGGGPQQGNP